MAEALRVLIADPRPESVLFLVQLLLARKHRVETCTDGQQALDAVLRRRAEGDPYHLLVCELRMVGLDGLHLARELRRHGSDVEMALCTEHAGQVPGLSQEVQHLGLVDVLDKPIDLGRIDGLLASVAARRPMTQIRRRTPSPDQPFFGTDRLSRGGTATFTTPASGATGALERRPTATPLPVIAPPPTPPAVRPPGTAPVALPPRSPLPQLPPPPSPPQLAPLVPPAPPAPTGYRRTNSQVFGAVPTTGQHRRPSGVYPGAPNNSVPGQTTRIRRSVTGTGEAPPDPGRPAITEQGRMVACAHCAKAFVVMNRAQPYNVVCVHCGGLNRIDPA